MKNLFTFTLLFLCVCFFTFNSNAAYLENVPVEVRQPNGQVLKCFATGDEFHNWLHDKNNYTIVRNKQTGYYVYAILKNGVFSASDYVVGEIDPASVGISPGLNVPREKTYLKSANGEDKSFAPTSGDLNNIVIYIRFADQAEFTTSQTNYESMFNGAEYSLTGYFHEVSGGQLNVHTTFYPSPQNDLIVSYQDIHPRNYYVPYDAISNPIGYLEEEATEREHALLENAIESVKSTLEGSAINFDSDADNYVDNVCFIVQGATEGWSDLLWPHKWALYTRTVTIAGSRVWEYNFQLSDATNVSVLCHEMFHTLGAPDLYHYDSNYNNLYPVAGWDLMASNTAQHTLTWMKFKYGNWMDEVPEIFGQGTYKLPAVGNNPFACYKIRVPESTNEFFMVEYRKKVGYDTNLSGSYDEGLLVYRVNSNLEGNAWGPPDELYVLRPGVTNDIPNGRWYDATLSENQNRTVINNFSDPLPLLADGSESSLSIYDVGLIGDSIEFKVGDPVITSDTLQITQLLPQTPAILSVNDTVNVNFYYQTTGENILINVTPISAGQEVTAIISDQSNVFSEKMGVGKRSFCCTADCLVNELRFRFLNSSTQSILYETYVPVYYRFVEDSIQYSLETDSLALVALYNACNGTGWNNNTNWLSTEPLASWYGITIENERVTGLELFSDNWSVRFGLQGELPAAIGNLTKLKTLNFQGNELSGSIPISMGRLLELETLNLVQNSFSGELPAILGNLVFLKNLTLYTNNLSGELPIELSNLTELTYLNLGANNFSGSFGEIIGNLSQLQTLYLSYNDFVGNLPTELGALQNLYSLYLSGNNFNGEIPNEVYGLQNLRYLYLDYNELSGELPAAIGNLSNLHYLYLNNNSFSGTLPGELCTIPLNVIQLGSNNLDSSSCPVVACLIDNGVALEGDLQQQSGYSLADCVEQPGGFAINEYSLVYTDTGMFYDSGFNLNYSDNESDTITFLPATEGGKLSFNFLEFSTEGCCDFLRIYDGESIDESTLIGEYRGVFEFLEQIVATNPAGALTFYFYSDGSVTDLGWKAEISVVRVVDSTYILSCNDVIMENGTITSCSYDFSNTDIIIPDTLCDQLVTGIGSNVFSSKGITSVKMPSTLEFIEESAFEHNQIQSVDFSRCTQLNSIGALAFMANNLTQINLPESITNYGGGLFNGNNITILNGQLFDGFIYSMDDASILISYTKESSGVTIPAHVTKLGDHALNSCGLTNVDLSQCSELREIGYRAFFANQIPSIDLSLCSSLETIGNSGFLYSGLDSIDLSECTKLTFIGGAAFASNNFSNFYLPRPELPGMQFENWTDGYQNILEGGEIASDLDVWYRANFTPDTLLPMEINITVMDPFCYGSQGVLEVSISGGLGGSYTYGGQSEEALTDSNAYVVMVYDLNAQNFIFERVLADYSDSAVFSVNPGTYNVIVEDSAGNDRQQMVVVQEPERLEMDAYTMGAALCPGDTAEIINTEVFGGIEPYRYSVYKNGELLYDFSPTSSFMVPVGAQYEVIVRDANGCMSSNMIDVDQINPIDWRVEATTCYGDQDATAQIIVEDGVPGRNYVGFYSLYEDGILVSKDTTDFFENEVQIDGLLYDNDNLVERNYSFLIMDDWGCISEETFVAFNPVQEPLLTSIDELNVGEFSADIQIQINGGTAPYRLELDGIEIEDLFQTITTGAHSLLVEDAHQCFVRDTFWVGPDLDCPQHFHPVWEGIGVYDPMNIYIINARVDGDNLQAGDQIGIFDGDLCVGFGRVEETIDHQNVLSIIAGADDGTGIGFTTGNEISYKIWRCNDETEFDVSDAYCFDNQLDPVDCSAFQAGASSFVDLFVTTKRFFATDFQPGWNIFSLPVMPDSADMEYNFYDLIQAGLLVKIQDETGASLEDLGVFGDWNNEIGDIRLAEGYKVKVTEYDSLYFSGSLAKYPFGIPLNPGWNIMGFPSFSYVNGMEVVQQLIDRGTLIKVQNEQGKSIENLGIYGGWQNFIGNFWAGEGYKIKVSSPDTLWISESYPKSTVAISQPINLQHFKTGSSGNGVDHMNVNLVDVNKELLAAGDELAVYDGSTCVGALVITEAHLRNQIVSIPASAADNTGMPGFKEGKPFSLRIWKVDQNREIEMITEHLSGPAVFTKHESVLLRLEKSALTKTDEWNGNGSTEVNCYPNPFTEEVTIELRLVTNADVEIEVLNQMGQRVKYLAPRQQLNAGIHRLAWDGTNSAGNQVSPGIYYLKIILGDSTISKKMIYNKR